MTRYFVKFNRRNNRFEIYDTLGHFVITWYKNASLAFEKLQQLNEE
jgi:hypothetical protein